VLVKIIVANIDRGDDLSFLTELDLQSPRRSGATLYHPDGQTGLLFATESGKKLVDDVNDLDHA